MKALYLDGRAGLDVGLDGPALRVRRTGRANTLYPLQRVARVVTVGGVRWQPDALTACLRDHKPVAVLDSRGRFVRILFRTPSRQFGLARHMGELLAVPRFQARYQRWLLAAERVEVTAAVRCLDISCRDLQPNHAWQMICREQHRRWGVRTGSCYRYLLGLAAAHIASAFALIGMPRDPQTWGRREYELFCDMLRLERWRQAALLEPMLAYRGGQPDARTLTWEFEEMSGEREQRIAAWRREALLEMMGAAPDRGAMIGRLPDRKQGPPEAADMAAKISRDARKTSHVLEAERAFRATVRAAQACLEYDRRMHESYRAT